MLKLQSMHIRILNHEVVHVLVILAFLCESHVINLTKASSMLLFKIMECFHTFIHFR